MTESNSDGETATKAGHEPGGELSLVARCPPAQVLPTVGPA